MQDVKLQATQAILLSSINCQLKATDALLTLKSNKEHLNTCLDGITLAMTTNYELNLRRRETVRPRFTADFAKTLCCTENPSNEFLFGGDTSKKVKEVAELNKNRVCKRSFSRGRGPKTLTLHNFRIVTDP